jgi:hypothetical protein
MYLHAFSCGRDCRTLRCIGIFAAGIFSGPFPAALADLLIAILAGFCIAFADEFLQAGLELGGKSSKLSDRTPLWEAASKTIRQISRHFGSMGIHMLKICGSVSNQPELISFS